MSRIGKKPISLPAGVSVTVSGANLVTVKGAKGELSEQIHPELSVAVEGAEVTVSRPTEQKRHRAAHGLYRSLIANMVVGVTNGYKHELELVGVGYKAEATGQLLELNLGYSHLIHMLVPKEISVVTETKKGTPPKITLEGIDKQLIGHIAAKIRKLRPPEPYKGKGIRFVGEVLRRKAGKTAAK
ncbi:MAG TPA: 50S ribosomal protein L6 [Bacteroidetes bacterium]|nr:50S ribosomal protein L6 [Bacteroidota bacterium]